MCVVKVTQMHPRPVPSGPAFYHCWRSIVLAGWTSHFSTKLDVKMSNYCACRDHGPRVPQTVVRADPFQHIRWASSPPLDLQAKTFCCCNNRLNALGTFGFQKKSICISSVFGSPAVLSWFIPMSTKLHDFPAVPRLPELIMTALTRLVCSVSELKLPFASLPGNTNFKKNSHSRA